MIAQERLDSHHARRLSGIPVISVLAGTMNDSIREWKRWSNRCGLNHLIIPCVAPGEITARWVNAATDFKSLRQAALQLIGRGAAEFERKSISERRIALEHSLHGPDVNRRSPAVQEVCKALLLDQIGSERGELVLAEVEKFLSSHSDGRSLHPPEWMAVSALAELYEPEGLPALLVLWDGSETPAEAALDALVRDLCRVLQGCPFQAIGVAMVSDIAERYLKSSGETRWKAMAREGLVPCLPEKTPVAKNGGNSGGALDTAERKAAQVAIECAKAARGPVETAEADCLARSAAEQFLFSVLEKAPDTATLFRLNVSLPFSFGVKAAEADLLAPDLKLVIEIDGFYHFADRAAYRRDRRKDLLLQQHGYLVLRFLAEDVVECLETILAEIRSAVAAQRIRHPKSAAARLQ
jgi:Protein of unknown function (DUF559)